MRGWIAPLRCQQRWLYTNSRFLLFASLEAAVITAVRCLICSLQLQSLRLKSRTWRGIYQLPGVCTQAGFHQRAAACTVPHKNGVTKQHRHSVQKVLTALSDTTKVPKAIKVEESFGGIKAWHQIRQLSYRNAQ